MSTQKEFESLLEGPITLHTMGSFAYGGDVRFTEEGDSLHCNHGYTQYFVPEKARKYPIIFWHGLSQSGKCFETTADGREGFWQIFSRLNFPVYIIDQYGRGRANHTTGPRADAQTFPNQTNESANWSSFRVGPWVPPGEASVYEGSQFPSTPAAIDQFFRSLVDHIGDSLSDEYLQFLADQMNALFEQTGDHIMFSHSMSGRFAWAACANYPEHTKALFTYEPGALMFPDDAELKKMDSPIEGMAEMMAPHRISREKWMNLTRFPIRIYFGDFLPSAPKQDYGNEVWRICMAYADEFCEMINANGGDAKVIMLPDLGLHGNTHSAFADLNNKEFARVIADEIHALGLDADDTPYRGPYRTQLKEYTIKMGKPAHFGE